MRTQMQYYVQNRQDITVVTHFINFSKTSFSYIYMYNIDSIALFEITMNEEHLLQCDEKYQC